MKTFLLFKNKRSHFIKKDNSTNLNIDISSKEKKKANQSIMERCTKSYQILLTTHNLKDYYIFVKYQSGKV